MLERLAGAEVCGEQERTDDLGGADRFATRGRNRCDCSWLLGCHTWILRSIWRPDADWCGASGEGIESEP